MLLEDITCLLTRPRHCESRPPAGRSWHRERSATRAKTGARRPGDHMRVMGTWFIAIVGCILGVFIVGCDDATTSTTDSEVTISPASA